MSGFSYNQNRQLFYHEGTAPYISPKIRERLNKIIFGKYSKKQRLVQSPRHKRHQNCPWILWRILFLLKLQVFTKNDNE